MSEGAITGSCLCRRATYAISGHLGVFQYCHCSRCRKFTGSAFAANLFVYPITDAVARNYVEQVKRLGWSPTADGRRTYRQA